MTLSIKDLEDLKTAVMILENPSFAARLTSAVGSPIEKTLNTLPQSVSQSLHEAAHKAIARALDLAVSTLDTNRRSSGNIHRTLSGVSGAVGGFFGAGAMAVELPVSTVIMLRAIADVARSEGEDLSLPETRLACLEVFALGGRAHGDDDADVGYYAVRAALAKSVSEAAQYLAQRSFAERSAPVLVRLAARITSRFSTTVAQKVAAQALPALGAIGGASVNLMFVHHFQDMARGHFIVRRLEHRYGRAVVEMEYRRIRQSSLGGGD